MKTTPKKKVAKKKVAKHKARDSDLEYAAELVRLYRGKDPLGKGGPIYPGGPVVGSIVDGDWLAMELQHFANYGTWDETAEVRGLRQRNMRLIAREHMSRELAAAKAANKKMTVLDAAEIVHERIGVSVDTAKNARSPRKPKLRKT